ncbi:type II toxin-antitoxin system PemK/MazF family toxin [Methanococcus maripaludis]|uniref:mRNA interferase MazF n=2 Tax=Methanococcus maripaludis TaxID=39152 RepID=A0A7J9PI56_METMI|nr:type II toxin-antitoxin system PemK/MazF family toxin [Methanococcus maripaludis]MBA2862474.1 mRNA interferase MazF [Methanococcus maripaludis]
MFDRWNIYWIDLEPVIGSEQGKKRPSIIISRTELNEILPVLNIIPITTHKNGRIIYPNETLVPIEDTGLKNESIALCHQIRTVDKSRINNKIGTITNPIIQNSILESLKFQLELDSIE